MAFSEEWKGSVFMNPATNYDIEQALNELPDQVADALEKWRIATLDREKCEALLYAGIKGEDKGKTATEIRADINASQARYESVLEEIKAESNYQRLYEKLLAAKRKASLRTAF